MTGHPFTETADPGSAPAQPTLRLTGTTDFTLTTAFWYQATTGPLEVPANHVTDLATVPRLLWGLVASYGHQTLPAIMHDYLSDQATAMPQAAEGYQARRTADDLFRQALRDVGVDPARAATFWAAVVLDRYFEFRRLRGVLLVVIAAVATAAFYGAWATLAVAGTHAWRAAAVLLAVAAIIPALWRPERLWRVLYVGAYVGVPVVAVFLIVLLAQVVTRLLPWAVLKLLSGITKADPGPVPPLGPTLAPPPTRTPPARSGG